VLTKQIASLKNLILLPALLFGAAAAAGAETHYYSVTVDYSLRVLWVEARFSHPVDSVTARARNAGRYLRDVRGCGEEPTIKMRNRRMMLPQDGIRCLNYTVDLEQAAQEYRNSRDLADNNIVASPAFWLWRPELFGETELQIDFRLPEGVRVSVPWQEVEGVTNRYRLGRSPESAYAPVLFGRFDFREIAVPGAKLRVAILETNTETNHDAIFNFVQTTATDVSLAYGRFPNPSPQVVVMPGNNSRSADPVSFGRVVRDGGETVELYIDPQQPLASLVGDWKATHEFSHLMLPYLHSEYHWISEGFAQYYQNVLLTRGGEYDEVFAWQKLYSGYERGRLSQPELSPHQAAASDTQSSRMKVYWSGAAIALLADVTLRERSGGKESLDTVLSRFQQCCLPSRDVWSGPEFFTKLDMLADAPVFMPLYRRYADTAGFPDTTDVLARLGLKLSDGVVSIRRRAELQEIREAIMETAAPIPQWRGELAGN
jgi:hypothetical protein